MIESVKARQRGAFNFEDHYENLCALQDSAPLDAVKAHLAKDVLDLNGDRIRCNDWQPIINTIKINKSLQFIAVRSSYQVPVVEEVSKKRLAIFHRKVPGKVPAVRSKEITHRLVKALKDCLLISPSLAAIELQGLSLRVADIVVLLKGVTKSKSLRHLSLENCRIGDNGMEVFCRGLKNTKNINSINISSCGISAAGAESLACLIKHQGVQRHNEAWQDSLRYRRPELDRMSGIRRITANNNPLLGDEGTRLLADALKDDLWLKALDLQSCGISNSGAEMFLEVLKYNTTLIVLDIRKNPLIERGTLHALMEQLMLNSSGENEEYTWITTDEWQEQTKKPTRPRRRATKILNSSLGKKTTIKVTPTNLQRRARACGLSTRKYEVPASAGFPWRTAARANRFRGHPPGTARFYADELGDGADVETEENISNNFAVNADSTKPRRSSTPNSTSSRMKRIKAETTEAMKKLEESHLSLDLTNHKEVLVELEQMRRHLREERLSRARSDQQVISLMIENKKLMEEVASLRRGHRTNKSILDDDNFLDSIETAFRQFHGFIDMLKDAGLGQLVTMAGLDVAQIPFNNKSSHKTISLTGSNKNNNNSLTGKYGVSVSQTQSPTSRPAAYDNSYKNVHTDSSIFLNGLHTPSGQSSFKTTVSTKDIAGIRGDDSRSKTLQTNIYDEKSEIARQEADELYSHLLKESRKALGQDIETSEFGSTFTRPNLIEVKEGHEIGLSEDRDNTRLLTVDNFEDRQLPLKGNSKVIDVGTSHEESVDDGAVVYGSERDLRDLVDTQTEDEAAFYFS